METVSCGGLRVKIDEDGFLLNPEDWNDEVACLLAGREDVELTEEKMPIIRFLRNYYLEFHAFPILRYVCRGVNQPRSCVNEAFIDPMKAWKIAGLPHLEGVEFVSSDAEGRIFEASVPT